MRKCFVRCTVLLGLVICWPGTAAVGADRPVTDNELVDQTWQRLLAVCDPVAGLEWPPAVRIEPKPVINAYATVLVGKTAGGEVKLLPRVVVFQGMLDKVIRPKDDPDKAGAPDRLAYVLGHELSHILLGHIKRPAFGQTEFTALVFGRDQETAADVKGTELALKAGYSMRRGLTAIHRMMKMGLEYSSFEGLSADHPSWSDRLTYADRDQAKLWKSMSAFSNGTYFLLTEQYAAAETCFRRVTQEFPKCPEAWTNLGYALLMQYCDGLDTDDLRQLKVGQILVGGFYRRPKSLEPPVRGRDEKIWQEAVSALTRSLKLDPGQALAKADLGVAYLVHPSGTPSVALAGRYLQEAAARAKDDDDLDPWARATVLINAGVADLAGKRAEESARRFDEGEQVARRLFGSARLVSAGPLGTALLYNRALLLAGSGEAKDQSEATELLEKYLHMAASGSSWWPLAYERYAALCKKLGKDPKAKEELANPFQRRWRLVTNVRLGSGARIVLSEPVADAAARLGEKVPVVSRTKLVRLRYPGHGVEVLATDTVLAICLVSPKAPPLVLRGAGQGAPTRELRLATPQKELDKILEDQYYDLRKLESRGVTCRFYPALGLGVRFKDEKVAELVVAQIPRVADRE